MKCDGEIGELLATYPEPMGRDAQWPCEEIAGLLEEINSTSMFGGFGAGIVHKLGVVSPLTTEGENFYRLLAQKIFK